MPPTKATIMDKSLGNSLHFWRFCAHAKREKVFQGLLSTIADSVPFRMNIEPFPFYESVLKRNSPHFYLLSFREAKLLNHSKNPCANLKDFVPDTTGETYLFYLRMDAPRDFITWSNVARCFRMWDLDARGFHKGMWRFWIKKNHLLAIGCPASVYCKTKPQDVKPIYLPNKETRPRDPP